VDASNRFAFGLLAGSVSASAGDNVFLSPLSASMALGMTANGAAGETRAEMLAALGFGTASMEEANGAYRSLIDMLRGLDPKVDFRIANAIWHDRGLGVAESFKAATRQSFDAEITPVSFADPGTLALVNGWVRTATNGKIEKVADEFDPDLVMLLANAIYFKGQWRDRFDEARTEDGDFLSTSGPQRVRMMKGQPAFREAHGPGWRAYELPYGASAYVMDVVVPTTGTADELAASLDAAGWDAIVRQLEADEATSGPFEMPRFKLEYKEKLNATLQDLGMRRAFGAGADFTAMSPTDGGRIQISEVLQKTFVEVNEEGTEAAAVTTVGAVIVCACPPPTVRIDRPFLFAIRERLSGTILFVGRINRIP